MSGRESNPGTELADRFRAMNVPVLGGDFADWCRANDVGIGGTVEITWSAGKIGVGNTVVFRVTAIGERKILAIRTDEDYGETLLAAEGHPIHGIRKLTEGSAAPPAGVDRGVDGWRYLPELPPEPGTYDWARSLHGQVAVAVRLWAPGTKAGEPPTGSYAWRRAPEPPALPEAKL